MLAEALERPFFGYGYGTRVTIDDPGTGVEANACVLDNQWLGTLLDVGFAGILAWGWLLLGFVRRGAAAARAGDAETSWLLTALVASVAACSGAMLLFDTFAFIQVMLLLFILLALGATVLASEAEETADERAPAAAVPLPSTP